MTTIHSGGRTEGIIPYALHTEYSTIECTGHIERHLFLYIIDIIIELMNIGRGILIVKDIINHVRAAIAVG